MKLAKEKFNSNTSVKKCGHCTEFKPVYLETKIKNTHKEDTPLCSKVCVRKAFGVSPTLKRA